ncbi:MAG: CopG family antitoxin [Dehalococcoidia bacterium]
MSESTDAVAGRIPRFSSYEEEAAFWDTHDTTEFEGEFQSVEVRFARSLSQTLNIRLDATTLNLLREEAHRKGVGPTTLARMWILEHLSASHAS